MVHNQLASAQHNWITRQEAAGCGSKGGHKADSEDWGTSSVKKKDERAEIAQPGEGKDPRKPRCSRSVPKEDYRKDGE